MSWNLKGRQAVAALDPTTRYRVVHSHTMTKCANKPLMWVIEELTTIPSVGGLSGPTRRVEYFLCLVTRILQICPTPEVILAMLRQDIHKYVRVAAMLVIRLIGSPAMINEAVALGLDDYRKVRVYGDEEELPLATVAASLDTMGSTGGSAYSLGSGGGIKRSRSGAAADDAKAAEEEQLEVLASLKPSHYFIWRLDEVTVKIFQLLPEESKSNIPSGTPGAVFMGIPLPPLVDKPVALLS